MEPGNSCCPHCTSRTVQCFCICQFPLPPLCASGKCAEAHVNKKSGLFHYFLPTSAPNVITARNHRSFLQWIIALNLTQSRLIDSLSLLDAAMTKIEESYQREVIALTALKDKYLARVNQLKEAATEAFHSAVRETTENAVNSEYVPQSDITQWIWTMASSAEDDDTPLFQSEVRERTEDEISLHFAVKVSSTFHSLQLWDLTSPGGETTKSIQSTKLRMLQIEVPDEKTAEGTECLSEEGTSSDRLKGTLIQRLVTGIATISTTPRLRSEVSEKYPGLFDDWKAETLSIGKVEDESETKRDRQLAKSLDFESQRIRGCKTCGSPVPFSREGVFCSNFCQCSVCWIQSFFDSPFTRSCKYCKTLINLLLFDSIKNTMEKCHVCGLVVDKSEMVKKASCKVCIHCIVIFTKSQFLRPDKVVGVCSQCGVEQIKLEKDEINVAKMQRACCRSEDQGNIQLACGHFACGNHLIWLKRCRVCQQQTENQ